MKRAEEMRLITERAKLVQGAEIAKKHKDYVNKLIRNVVRVEANKGKKFAVIKPNRRYSVSMIVDLFIKDNFKVEQKVHKNKKILVVSW